MLPSMFEFQSSYVECSLSLSSLLMRDISFSCVLKRLLYDKPISLTIFIP